MDPLRTFPVLETDRLLLRETTQNDARALFEVFADEEVTRYYNIHPLTEVEQARRIVESRKRRFESGGGIRWALACKEDNRVIGSCGFVGWTLDWRKAEVGYELGRAWWGQGLMTEALREVLGWGYRRLELNRVEALVMPENAASRRLLTRLGFTEEGLLREAGYWKGSFHDLKMFSLLKSEFQGR